MFFFYVEVWTRVNGKLSCTQVKCTWILPADVKEVNYSRIADINFSSARKLKADLEKSLDPRKVMQSQRQSKPVPTKINHSTPVEKPSPDELNGCLASLSECILKSVALSLVEPYSDSFVLQSRNIPTITDLLQEKFLDLTYPELLEECNTVNVELPDKDIKVIEKETVDQTKGGAFFLHQAGRIGASRCKAASHTDPSLPSQSLIKTICYPNLCKFTSKATLNGCNHEDDAIRAHETVMRGSHKNFKISKCGLLINKEIPFLHATCDFLCSRDCCSLGCGEVKCPFCVEGCDFASYITKTVSCLEKVDDVLQFKRDHTYYYQVQQQLFTTNRENNDFVVLVLMGNNTKFFHKRIFPNKNYWEAQVPKLTTFWRTYSILPQGLGRWYTKKVDNTEGTICYCRKKPDVSEPTVFCSNDNCLVSEFHFSCILPSSVKRGANIWYCPNCRKLE